MLLKGGPINFEGYLKASATPTFYSELIAIAARPEVATAPSSYGPFLVAFSNYSGDHDYSD